MIESLGALFLPDNALKCILVICLCGRYLFITMLNLYKWLAIQQSNNMIASGSQNQLQSSLTPLGDILKTLIFLSNLNGFNSSPSPLVQGFARWKGSSKVWKEKGSKWFYYFSLSLFLFLCVHYLCVLLSSFESV